MSIAILIGQHCGLANLALIVKMQLDGTTGLSFGIFLFITVVWISAMTLCKTKRSRLSFLEKNVHDKVFLVTGGAGGIGSEVSLMLAQSGAQVVIADLYKDRIDTVVSNIRNEISQTAPEGLAGVVVDGNNASGVDTMVKSSSEKDLVVNDIETDQSSVEKIIGMKLDCSVPAECRDVIEKVIKTKGRLDGIVFVHNLTRLQAFRDIPKDDIAQVMHESIDSNLCGTMLLLYHAMDELRNRAGYVVYTSSLSSFMGAPKCAFYTACKVGIHRFFDSIRLEEKLGYGVPDMPSSSNGFSLSIVCLPSVGTKAMIDSRPDASSRSMLQVSEAAWRILEAMIQRKVEIVVSGPGQPASILRSIAFCCPGLLRNILLKAVRGKPLTDQIVTLKET